MVSTRENRRFNPGCYKSNSSHFHCLSLGFSENHQNRKYAHWNSLAAKEKELWELVWPNLRDHTKLFANHPEPLSTPLTTSTLPASRPQVLFLAVGEITQQIIHNTKWSTISVRLSLSNTHEHNNPVCCLLVLSELLYIVCCQCHICALAFTQLRMFLYLLTVPAIFWPSSKCIIAYLSHKYR